MDVVYAGANAMGIKSPGTSAAVYRLYGNIGRNLKSL